jgi:hypothetical protein
MVVVNLEARVPITPEVQVVPYDGGNVFRSMSDIFHPQPITPTGNSEDLRTCVRWSHTLGVGFRSKTPLGGALAIDYGFAEPVQVLIPQFLNTPTLNCVLPSHQGQILVSVPADVLARGEKHCKMKLQNDNCRLFN